MLAFEQGTASGLACMPCRDGPVVSWVRQSPGRPSRAVVFFQQPPHKQVQVAWNSSCCSWWHLPQQMLLPTSYYAAPLRFCVVRDPFTRLFSAYEKGHAWVNYVNGSTLCQQIETHRSGRKPASFRAWVEEEAAKISSQPARNDCHLLPQLTYLAPTFADLPTLLSMSHEKALASLNNSGPGCNIVLRFEQLRDDFERLMRWAGLDTVALLEDRVPRVSGIRGNCLSPTGVRGQLLPASAAADALTAADARLLGYPPLSSSNLIIKKRVDSGYYSS